jgi:hypothetical protein
MTDAHNTSSEILIDDSDDDQLDEISVEDKNSPISIDTRRRLEEKLAERQLAREMQEFDFDC